MIFNLQKNGGPLATTSEPPYPHDIIPLFLNTSQRIFDKCAPLYEKGLSLRDIQEQVGISKNLIRGALVNNGTPIRDYKTGKNVPKEWTKTKRAGHPPFGWTYLDGNLVIDDGGLQ